MKKSFFSIIILVAIGCGSKSVDSDIMSKEEMVNILIDLHLQEAVLQDIRLKADSAKVVFSVQERLIFKQYGVSDSLFTRSFQYYLENPVILEDIYTAVIDSLSLRQVLLRESSVDE